MGLNGGSGSSCLAIQVGNHPPFSEFTQSVVGPSVDMEFMNVQPLRPEFASRRKLAAKLEPFDSYWQAPKDIDSGYKSFEAYYRANYLPHLPADKSARILVVSCGPGYLLSLLAKAGYQSVVGIDS